MEPFKNNFSPELVKCIAFHLNAHIKDFNKKQFVNTILNELEALELKERSLLIAKHIHQVLPSSTTKRYKILKDILHPDENSELENKSDTKGIRGWGIMPLTAVVGLYGQDDFDESLNLLQEMTKRFSAEFDVRHFLIKDQKRALKIMRTWVKHPSHHVRRLASEGTRPRLPWGIQLAALIKNPKPALPILQALQDDESEYVRRSVANHLNDIAKDHPDLVVELAKKWMQGASIERQRLLKHACRTLVKNGHPEALKIFGFEKPKIKLNALQIKNTTLILGETLNFEVELQSTSTHSQNLTIDLILHLKKSNGKQSPKVFKWKTLSLNAKQKIKLTRSQAIKAVSTRKYYSGEQGLSLRINGMDFGNASFQLNIEK